MKNSDLGSKIRRIREFKGLTQEFMASELNVTQRSYSNLESNSVKIDWDRIQRIATIFEISPMDLINYSDQWFFDSCSQSGNINTINNTSSKLVEQYEARIDHLEKEVAFLRSQLSKN